MRPLSSRYRRVSKGGMQALALVTLAAMSGTATAVQLEVEGGRSYMDSHPTTTLFVEGVFPDHPLGNNRLTWSPDVSVGWIDGRQLSRYDGARYSPRDAVWLVPAAPVFTWAQPATGIGRCSSASSWPCRTGIPWH